MTNKDGYYIMDQKKWKFYEENPKIYKRKKFFAFCWIIIPVAGIAFVELAFDEMGLSIF